MSKFNKLIKALSLIVKQPSLLNKIINDADVNKEEVINKYSLPEGLKTVDITDLVTELNETVSPYSSVDGGSTPIDLALLKGLARNLKDCNYLEIGTWMGESVSNLANVAKYCVTLNLPDEQMLKMGENKKYVDLHRFYSKNLQNVNHIQANSQTFDFSSLQQKFDLIFIDGDHHYESIKNDTENAFKLLKDDTSIIVWHDYGNNPSNVRWDVLKGILDGTPAEKRKNLYRVSNTLCAIYITKEIKCIGNQVFSFPNKYFSISVKANIL